MRPDIHCNSTIIIIVIVFVVVLSFLSADASNAIFLFKRINNKFDSIVVKIREEERQRDWMVCLHLHNNISFWCAHTWIYRLHYTRIRMGIKTNVTIDFLFSRFVWCFVMVFFLSLYILGVSLFFSRSPIPMWWMTIRQTIVCK